MDKILNFVIIFILGIALGCFSLMFVLTKLGGQG